MSTYVRSSLYIIVLVYNSYCFRIGRYMCHINLALEKSFSLFTSSSGLKDTFFLILHYISIQLPNILEEERPWKSQSSGQTHK